MVCLGNFVAQLARWPRHTKDGVHRKFCGSVRWSRDEKTVCLGNFVAQVVYKEDAAPRKFCGSLRWSRHRKDGVPRNQYKVD